MGLNLCTLQDYKAKCEAIEKRESERRQLDEKKHAEEVGYRC